MCRQIIYNETSGIERMRGNEGCRAGTTHTFEAKRADQRFFRLIVRSKLSSGDSQSAYDQWRQSNTYYIYTKVVRQIDVFGVRSAHPRYHPATPSSRATRYSPVVSVSSARSSHAPLASLTVKHIAIVASLVRWQASVCLHSHQHHIGWTRLSSHLTSYSGNNVIKKKQFLII